MIAAVEKAKIKSMSDPNQVRLVYSGAPHRTTLYESSRNPDGSYPVFGLFGPFINHCDKESLQDAIERVLIQYNKKCSEGG